MPVIYFFRLTKTKEVFKSLSAFIINYLFELGNTTVSTGQEMQTEIFLLAIS